MKKISHVERAAARVMKQQPEKPAPPSADATCLKVTISLFPGDIEALEHLAEMLRRHCGILANRSDAIKTALRVAAETATPDAVKSHFTAYKAEDRRKRRKV